MRSTEASYPALTDAVEDVGVQQMTARWNGLLSFMGNADDVSDDVVPSVATSQASAAAPVPAKAPATSGTPDQPDSKEAKKAAKAEEKRRKEEEKERKRKEREDAARRKLEGPEVPSLTLLNFLDHPFGNLSIQSHCKTERTWTDVGDLTAASAGSKVWLRVRLHKSQKLSGKLGFITLRQRGATCQAVVQGPDFTSFLCALPKESVVDVCAEVTTAAKPIVSCTQSDIELLVERAYCISRAATRLPLQLDDAGRSEAELRSLKLPRVEQNTRLDNRVIDLRTASSQGILRMQSQTCALFREVLLARGFTEIHSPKMIATASEGGADVFKLGYFGGAAYLAQSPQLYKQMALMADLGRVFEIGPVFRSEKSFTHRHMTEFVGLDLEMTFNESYHEVLSLLEEVFISIFEGLNARCKREIEAVRAQYPFEDLRFSRPALRLSYVEALKLLREHGPAIGAEQLAALEEEQAAAAAAGDEERAKEMDKIIADAKAHLATVPTHADDEDISTKDEKLLGAVIGRLKQTDFYVIDKFPSCLRPFYTMPDPDDKKWSNSYDIFIRGEEVTSGAQRIHDPQMLVDNANAKGVDLTPIQTYVDSFKYGAFPHAGGGVGLERVVMLFLGLPNIRKTSMFPRDPKRLTP
uniref:aspartate--tRNA ligase n=1 Tax=Chrysotila carterae TaxID=13221 RepID=A0A7S4BY92_CHRCT